MIIKRINVTWKRNWHQIITYIFTKVIASMASKISWCTLFITSNNYSGDFFSVLLKWCEWFAFLGDVEITNLSSHRRSIWCSHKSTIVHFLYLFLPVHKIFALKHCLSHKKLVIFLYLDAHNVITDRDTKKTPHFYLALSISDYMACLHWSKKILTEILMKSIH